MASAKYPRNKIMAVAGYTYLVLFALLLITKFFLPDAGGGWSDPPIFDYLFILGMCVCFSILGIGYSYYSWTLNQEEYIQWYTDQQVRNTLWKTDFAKMHYAIWGYWSTRISAPLGALAGISVCGLMLFSILYSTL